MVHTCFCIVNKCLNFFFFLSEIQIYSNRNLFFFSVDVTVYHNGFHGDLNETFLVGNIKPEVKKLVEVTYECLSKAIDIVKPGEKYREIGNVIQKHAQAHGFSVVRSYCGHGIHRLFHTAPNVPHYASKYLFLTYNLYIFY